MIVQRSSDLKKPFMPRLESVLAVRHLDSPYSGTYSDNEFTSDSGRSYRQPMRIQFAMQIPSGNVNSRVSG